MCTKQLQSFTTTTTFVIHHMNNCLRLCHVENGKYLQLSPAGEMQSSLLQIFNQTVNNAFSDKPIVKTVKRLTTQHTANCFEQAIVAYIFFQANYGNNTSQKVNVPLKNVTGLLDNMLLHVQHMARVFLFLTFLDIQSICNVQLFSEIQVNYFIIL